MLFLQKIGLGSPNSLNHLRLKIYVPFLQASFASFTKQFDLREICLQRRRSNKGGHLVCSLLLQQVLTLKLSNCVYYFDFIKCSGFLFQYQPLFGEQMVFQFPLVRPSV